MHLPVLLTNGAAQDLEDIYDYIALNDSRSKADHVLERIEKAFTSLSENPERGVYPRELIALGLREFRQIFFKPYRIIYRIMENKVFILLISDGRRDMQELLQRRLFQG